MVAQSIRLESTQHYGSRPPSKWAGAVQVALPAAVRQAVRMAFEGRSHGKTRPAWLAATADVRLVGIEGDEETVLRFELPTLREAASRIYEQGELFPTDKPDAADTGLDLLADVIADITDRNADSARFDQKMLDCVANFRRFIGGESFTSLTFDRRGRADAVAVTNEVIETAKTLYTNVPVPKRVRIVGRLDMVRVSTQTFGVILDDGQEVRGVLAEGEIEGIAGLLKQRVQMLGKAIYRPSGRLLRVDAEEVSATTDSGSFFSAIPKPSRKRFDLREVLREQSGKGGIAAIIGKWPGDETDEEVAAALAEMS